MKYLFIILLLYYFPCKAQIQGYYKFNNDTIDYSGNSNTGTRIPVNNLPGYVLGERNQCIVLNGSTQYVSLPKSASLNLPTTWTISCWMRTTTVAAGTKAIIGDANTSAANVQFNVEVNRTAAKISIAWGTTVKLTGNYTLSANTWYYVVAQKTGTTGNWSAYIYVNGILDNSATGITANPGTQNGASIGRAGLYNGLYFNGNIDEVIIDNTLWTATKIKNMYTYYKGYYQ